LDISWEWQKERHAVSKNIMFCMQIKVMIPYPVVMHANISVYRLLFHINAQTKAGMTLDMQSK